MGDNTAKKLPQYVAGVSVCLGSVAAGTVLGWTSNIGVEMQKNGYNDISITPTTLGWIGSCATLGGMLMCCTIGPLCDLIGRKLALLVMIIPLMLGWILIIFASHVAMLYIGRFLTGTGGGAFCVACPLYTSEISQKEIRGALGNLFQLLLTVGILIANVFGYVLSIKAFVILCAVFPIIFGVVFFFQPETPKYLLLKEKDEAAAKALIKLRGKEYNPEAEIKEIKAQIETDKAEKVPLLQSFKKRNIKKAVMLSFGLMFFQQMCGINAVIFYAGNIFESTGGALKPAIGTIVIGVIQVIATLVSVLVVDKLGRKILLMLSGALMALSGIMLGIFFTLQERNIISHDSVVKIGFLPVLSLSIFIIMFSLGFGPIPWMISAELFANEIKSVASSAAGTFNWFLAFLITKFYFDVKEAVGGDITFYLFAGFSILAIVFVLFFLPETKNKPLEDIQKELAGE